MMYTYIKYTYKKNKKSRECIQKRDEKKINTLVNK